MHKIAALLLIGILMFGCAQQVAPQNSSTAADQSPNKIIKIKDFAFDPAETVVNMGMTIAWVNEDAAPHTVKFSDGSVSPVLSTGQNFTKTFMDSGEFSYSCGIHPSMKGTVKVLGATN